MPSIRAPDHGRQVPREKSLRGFDFKANPSIDPAVVHTLAKGEWVQKGQPLCLIGDSGTGKSHLLIALGTEAAISGFRVKYTLATKLANELVEAAGEKTLSKTIARYGRVDLLCIDELGYMQLDRWGAELLFQVLTEREEKASVAIASNESFSAGQDLHRPEALRRHRRPTRLRRHHHRNPAPTPTGSLRARSWSAPDGTPPPRGVVWNQTNIESASMPKVVSELTYKRCRIWDLAPIS
jgi:DNA replication protein DnaC